MSISGRPAHNNCNTTQQSSTTHHSICVTGDKIALTYENSINDVFIHVSVSLLLFSFITAKSYLSSQVAHHPPVNFFCAVT